MARVLTLVIAPDSEAILEESIEAADAASREHPCRVIVVFAINREHHDANLDARVQGLGTTQARVRSWYSSCPAHWPRRPVASVTPFLLPDAPVVRLGGRMSAPAVPTQDPLGHLAIRGITAASYGADPLASVEGGLEDYAPGDTDLAWSRITYWRTMLTSALDQGPHEPIQSALVSGLKSEPALDVLAQVPLRGRIDSPVQPDRPPTEGRDAHTDQSDRRTQQATGRPHRHPHSHRQTRRPTSVGAQGNP